MAVYNNGIQNGQMASTIQPYAPYMQQSYAQQPIYQNNGLIRVRSEAEMQSYLVAPNMTVALWDFDHQVVYLKSADAVGIASVKILDFTIRDPLPLSGSGASANVEYATKEDIAAINDKMTKLWSKLNSITKKEGQA